MQVFVAQGCWPAAWLLQAFAEEMAGTDKSNDSDKTVSGSGSVSTDSERTPVRVDSQDSQVSDGEAVERAWPRQNSVSCYILRFMSTSY